VSPRAQDALRKIALLRQVSSANGALDAEVDTAERLAKALMDRYAIRPDDVPSGLPAAGSRMIWVYWQDLLERYGLTLRHFGYRGNAAIGRDRMVYVNLRTSQWRIEQQSARGWTTIMRDWGVESLHRYLDRQMRGYSLMRR